MSFGVEGVPFLIRVWETGLTLRHSASSETGTQCPSLRLGALCGGGGHVICWGTSVQSGVKIPPSAAQARGQVGVACASLGPQERRSPPSAPTPAPGSTHGRPARAPCALSSLAEGVPLSSHRLSHFSLRPQHGPRAASGGEVAPSPDLGAEPPLSAARGAERRVFGARVQWDQ